ncbi:hypothetical protein [Streptomyces sp. JJ38]|uniref:DUF7848 domain-containing protein n=1 Tax=Streptomyces sp. JJ38 TaxID=2738128 RepID=UPI001C5732AA|nr:hypothetical protein [Streptomyces sp. JJ38]MBW1599721.1 hypothetical protein [Streptomyces sp. JJ38]
MSRGFLRRERWAIAPDLKPDREPTAYAVECAVCLARSPQAEEQTTAQDWIFEHAGRNPSHHTYRAITIEPLRAWRPDA